MVDATRTGLGAKAGHELTIQITRWHGQAAVDTANLVSSWATVEVDVADADSSLGIGCPGD